MEMFRVSKFIGILLFLWFSLVVENGLTQAEDAARDARLEIKARLNKNITIKEVFLTDVQQNSIVTHFQLGHGLICWVIHDFMNNVKIFKLDVLGETELGQKQYQSMCFVTVLNSNDIIPVEAMAKLRQKSSETVQEPNDVLRAEVIDMDVELLNIGTKIFGEKFSHLCSGRDSVIHAKKSELGLLAKGDAHVNEILSGNSYKLNSEKKLDHCSLTVPISARFQPCICKVPFTIAWYPCVIKYCQSKNSIGNHVMTRCGIRSCRKTYELGFVVNHPLSCHWGVT